MEVGKREIMEKSLGLLEHGICSITLWPILSLQLRSSLENVATMASKFHLLIFPLYSCP